MDKVRKGTKCALFRFERIILGFERILLDAGVV